MEPGLLFTQMHSEGGGAFFPSGTAAGDRSLRPHHHTRSTDAQNQQTLKCPRCDSLNTKFCYYNNYNLSQPRHFCRNCRRYWTKGGALRNVPVGCGCRKSKRSKPKNSTSAAVRTAPPPAPSSSQSEHERKTSSSHTGSENSSLTAVAAAVTTKAVSAPSSNSMSNNLFDNLQDSDLFLRSSSKPGSEAGVTEQGVDSGFFSEIESLTSLITPTNEALSFGCGNMREASPFQVCSQWQKGMNTSYRHHQDLKWPETMTTESSMEAVDWRGSREEQGLFDAGDTVEEGQWNGGNSSPFHLP